MLLKKKSSLREGSGSLLTAHVLKHMQPKYADCGSDHMVYTGEEGWLFDEWERGLYNKWLNQMWLKLLRKFPIDASVAEHCQRKENAGTKYYEYAVLKTPYLLRSLIYSLKALLLERPRDYTLKSTAPLWFWFSS